MLTFANCHFAGTHIIPSGVTVIVPILETHLNKDIWGEDAEKFIPERFATEHVKNLHPYAFLPFSKGQRNCIGDKYALKSMKVVLAHFFRNYKVTTSLKIDDITFKFGVVSRVAQRYMVRLSKRNFDIKA